MEIDFCVQIGYKDKIKSSDLFESANAATARYREDKRLKPKQIPLYKDN